MSTHSLVATNGVSTNQDVRKCDVRKCLPRGRQLRSPGQQFLEYRHETFAELREIVVRRPARAGVSRDQSGGRQLPQISCEFLLTDGRNRPDQFVVSLWSVEQQRAEDQEFPFAADNLNRCFNGARS